MGQLSDRSIKIALALCSVLILLGDVGVHAAQILDNQGLADEGLAAFTILDIL